MITGETQIRVRYGDTDKMGIVYYANYLEYFEVGRTEFIRQYYKPYAKIEDDGFVLPALSARVEYKNSATYDDLLTVKTTLVSFTRVRLRFEYTIYREERILVCIGATEHCFTDYAGKPKRMSEEMWAALKGIGNSEFGVRN